MANPKPATSWKQIIADMQSADPAEVSKANNIAKYVSAFEIVEAEQDRYEKGDQAALLHALEICLRYDLEIPKWIRDEFVNKYKAIRSHEKGSWDDAFGKPIPKGKHLSRLKQKRELRTSIYLRCRQLINQGVPIDAGLFETVGEEFGIGKTLTSELYYSLA